MQVHTHWVTHPHRHLSTGQLQNHRQISRTVPSQCNLHTLGRNLHNVWHTPVPVVVGGGKYLRSQQITPQNVRLLEISWLHTRTPSRHHTAVSDGLPNHGIGQHKGASGQALRLLHQILIRGGKLQSHHHCSGLPSQPQPQARSAIQAVTVTAPNTPNNPPASICLKHSTAHS